VRTTRIEEIPDEPRRPGGEYREKLLEGVAETTTRSWRPYLGGEEISVERLKAAIRKATIAARSTPVLTGTAFKNKGVQPLLDASPTYLPSRLDVEAIVGTGLDGETEVLGTPMRTSRSPRWPSRSRPTSTWAS
jgi:elongation factor G